jgi:heptosyltransferase-1
MNAAVPPRRILVIRLKSMGDVIFTIPAVSAMRAAFPAADISFLTSAENAALTNGFPGGLAPIALDRGALKKSKIKAIRNMIGLLHRIRSRKFDLVVDLQGYGETAWLTRLSGGRQRWGLVYRKGRAWAYTRTVNRNPEAHPADANLELIKACGVDVAPAAYHFNVSQNSVSEAAGWMTANGLAPGKPTLFFQPFTSSERKNWPLDRFLELAIRRRAAGGQIIWGGGPKEIARLEGVRQAGFPVAAGHSLPTIAGLLQLSSVVVGADTGVLHLASAIGRRVVMIISAIYPGVPCPYQHPEWCVTPPSGTPTSGVSIDVVEHACVMALSERTKVRS